MKNLFVSFFYTTKHGERKEGNVVFENPIRISGWDEVNKITQEIEQKRHVNDVVIINFRRME